MATGSHIGAPQQTSLDHALLIVSKAFDGEDCFIVGSALDRPDFRDVDVRLIMDDKKFDALFGAYETSYRSSPLWSLMMVAISEYLSKRTELPIDFQVQRRCLISEEEWNKERQPAAFYPVNDGLRPAWTK